MNTDQDALRRVRQLGEEWAAGDGDLRATGAVLLRRLRRGGLAATRKLAGSWMQPGNPYFWPAGGQAVFDAIAGPAIRTVPAGSLPGLGDPDSEVVWQLHRSVLDELAGRPVADWERDRIVAMLGSADGALGSPLSAELNAIVESVCGPKLDEDFITDYETVYDTDGEDECSPR